MTNGRDRHLMKGKISNLDQILLYLRDITLKDYAIETKKINSSLDLKKNKGKITREGSTMNIP